MDGHALRMPNTENTKVALFWTPEGKRKRGRPKETWRRTVAREIKERVGGHGSSWKLKPRTGHSGGHWLGPYVPKGTKRIK